MLFHWNRIRWSRSSPVLLGMARQVTSGLTERWRSDKLLRGFGVLGLGELFVRLSRIVTTIVLARTLDAATLGIAATALASFELVRVLGNNGIGQMVVRAPDERLNQICNTAWRLTVVISVVMAIIQVAAGVVISRLMQRPELLGMIACLAAVFIVYPWSLVHSWHLQRQYRMGALSSIAAIQVGVDNILTAGLALAGFGAWSIVLPKLLTAPIWLIGMRCAVSWRPDPSAGYASAGEICRYAAPILLSEALVAIRFNLDKMLVGALLGIEALGVYYFAFGAGYGLSLVLTSALAAASFPHLADHRIGRQVLVERFDRALTRLAMPISLLIVVQAVAVPYYVPVLFGAKWEPMTTVVAVLCLSAATKSWHDLSTQLLRAAGKPGLELLANSVFTVVFLGFFALGLTFGLLAGVTMLTIATVTLQLLFAAWARRQIAGCSLPLGSAAAVRGA
jgi:O-antigen/teichoic acid export membrane protein